MIKSMALVIPAVRAVRTVDAAISGARTSPGTADVDPPRRLTVVFGADVPGRQLPARPPRARPRSHRATASTNSSLGAVGGLAS
ncbi:hypothetical protein AB0L80_10715 [Streptomyces sp. NPDC052069]|uniref:hypothetical protein n=1 Tax=Streptomyces sp. NPDC052069 TaxID=3154650 RepID=UPI00343C8006